MDKTAHGQGMGWIPTRKRDWYRNLGDGAALEVVGTYVVVLSTATVTCCFDLNVLLVGLVLEA